MCSFPHATKDLVFAPAPSRLQSANASCITCTAGNTSAPGKYGVLVRSASGLAKPVPPLTFEYTATIANVTPVVGSIEGGTLVTLTGVGFAQTRKASRLMVGGRKAIVLSVNNDAARTPGPTAYPTPPPSFLATPRPTFSLLPSSSPTPTPTQSPTPQPSTSMQPTAFPSYIPSVSPSVDPTSAPTPAPSEGPSRTPSSVPISTPTSAPLEGPSNTPTGPPSGTPSSTPTLTVAPSSIPTFTPTSFPSYAPTTSGGNRRLGAPARGWLEQAPPGEEPTSKDWWTSARNWWAPTPIQDVEDHSVDTVGRQLFELTNETEEEFVFLASSSLVARIPSSSENSSLSSTWFETVDTRRQLLNTEAASDGLPEISLRLTSDRVGGAEALHIHAGSIWYSVPSYVSIIWSPGVYGVEERLWTSATRGMLSLFFNPVARTVVSYLHTSTLSETCISEHIDFIACLGESGGGWSSGEWSAPASGKYVLVMVSDSNYQQHYSEKLTVALEACGGSSMLNTLPSYDGDWHAFPFALVGQCGNGLGSGWSANRGLELKGDSEWSQVDLELDLADYFTFGDDARLEGVRNFTYDPALTPTLLSISRNNGTTAGGTTVSLNVTGLGKTSLADITVKLAGVVCSTTADEVRP